MYKSAENIEPAQAPQKTKNHKIKVKSDTIEDIHRRLTPAIDRNYWLGKIWKTEQLESHENGEQVTILYWFKYNGANGVMREHEVKYGPNNSVCGPCKVWL